MLAGVAVAASVDREQPSVRSRLWVAVVAAATPPASAVAELNCQTFRNPPRCLDSADRCRRSLGALRRNGAEDRRWS